MRFVFMVVSVLVVFTTSVFSAEVVHFITFGDWGTGSTQQRAVADAATAYCRHQPCEFVLALGDNFYPSGVRSVRDPLWQRYYRDVYSALKLPFYAIIGNHDERGDVQAQVDYGKLDPSWHMPATHYAVTFPQGSITPLLELFVINNSDNEFPEDVRLWLQGALARSKAAWKVLALHKPVISNGHHGDDSAHINDALVPVICGKVDILLSGHDHSFSHLRGPWKGCMVDQLIVGTGGVKLRSVRTTDPRVFSTGSFFGFGWFSATAQQLSFRMIRTDGTKFYEAVWKR